MTKKIIVFHDACHDGLTALWCALQSPAWKDAEPYAGNHGEPPDFDRLRDADVLIVDFSWKRPDMARIADVSASITVLDHHKSAEDELRGFHQLWPHIAVIFDMNRSGAGLAWDELVGGKRPKLVDYVEDRDLYKFALPYSREVHAYCDSYALTLAERGYLARTIQDDDRWNYIVDVGSGVLRYHNKLAKSIAAHARMVRIAGHDVPCVACPALELVSDVGHILAKIAPFAATYVDRAEGDRYYSLRSEAPGADVSTIAQQFGGGGHRAAAGFSLTPYEINANVLAHGKAQR